MIAAEIFPDVFLDVRRALWLARARLLVVADLHWGYAESHRVQGNLLPVWGDDELATRLRALEADYRPAAVVWLGDSLHTLAGVAPAEAFLAGAVTPTLLVSGNHDRQWLRRVGSDGPLDNIPASIARDGYYFHHGHEEHVVPEGYMEVIGHHHPALSWSDRAGGRLKLPALVAGPRRMILPAFSPWASGVPWNAHLQSDETLYAIATKRIMTLPHALLNKTAACA